MPDNPSKTSTPPLCHLGTSCAFWVQVVWFVCLGALGSQGCVPRLLHDITPPTTLEARRQVQWFRITFQKLYQREQRAQDFGDRLRLFVQRFPKLSTLTYRANFRHLFTRRLNQKSYGDLERYYLLMNLLIAESLPARQKQLAQIRQEVQTRGAPETPARRGKLTNGIAKP